jgi:hypothetical protein
MDVILLECRILENRHDDHSIFTVSESLAERCHHRWVITSIPVRSAPCHGRHKVDLKLKAKYHEVFSNSGCDSYEVLFSKYLYKTTHLLGSSRQGRTSCGNLGLDLGEKLLAIFNHAGMVFERIGNDGIGQGCDDDNGMNFDWRAQSLLKLDDVHGPRHSRLLNEGIVLHRLNQWEVANDVGITNEM